MFGLSSYDFKSMMQIILNHKPELKRVVIFGSRARGDFQKHSDIDLAIFFNEKNPKLKADFDESKLSVSVDIVDLSLENNTQLASFIKKEGIVLYDANDQTIGVHWMTTAILEEKLTDYQNALKKLQEALLKQIEKDDLYLDGTIQRFEFTYELAWKLMKAYLKHLGIEVNNPRNAIRESIKQELIIDSQDWFDMIEKRNDTSHTYHKEIALSVYAAISASFMPLLVDFETNITRLIKHE